MRRRGCIASHAPVRGQVDASHICSQRTSPAHLRRQCGEQALIRAVVPHTIQPLRNPQQKKKKVVWSQKGGVMESSISWRLAGRRLQEGEYRDNDFIIIIHQVCTITVAIV